MLVGESEQQFIQLGLCLLYAAQGVVAAGHSPRTEDRRRDSRRRYRLVAAQLLGEFLAPADGDRQIGLGLLGGVCFALQLREVAALLARHQADIPLLERSQAILGGAQALLIVLDLRLEKSLGVFRTLALAAQSLIHKGAQQLLDHPQAALAA